ncbi:MAG: bifunctional UDP-N-acetylglucosamine diphosphorylase/glucosamine-1-phosphate N-acetyltransferase GlmU [Candidatus Endonucleobacter bathymodioli]|uniref:Bifunctional protein GlmU n=1 Tax=Candidatus Endonucleibacter bathymodioli TaxID=539814 RepID=A0AA90NW36_9GAMM|nr:bifunctional UDP-N-acetylglucosamine diphosphorylase/glucosamine-1-phosphate N-acetyltransferase GlmU [Candidatus Endonucleobacter bathymodioli]
MRTDIVILAAGKGSRMKSSLPKVLHSIAGKPMLERVIMAASASLGKEVFGDIHVVLGHESDQILSALSNYDVNWVQQREQCGTGHAVKQALPSVKNADVVLVIYGDIPLIKAETLMSLIEVSRGEHLVLLTAIFADPCGYGRIVKDVQGHVQAIVEHKDADAKQLAINEVNTGIMAVPGRYIEGWLNKLKNSNSQREFYLTDIVNMAVRENVKIHCVQPASLVEVQGVNNLLQLSDLERAYQQQQAKEMMLAGVTIMDPQRVDFRGEIKVGRDVVLDVNVVFEGDVILGNNVVVEANCIIRNSRISDGAIIKANSIIEDSEVLKNCKVGPFARLRPGTELDDGVIVGNFVEVKKSRIGRNSKINHLTYVGDAEIGVGVNVGAGVVTCNYDGVNKHKTVIGDGAFIGTNSSLVAPVTIGKRATTAAGSTITRTVSDDELGVARGRQRNIRDWRRPTKNKVD